MRDHNPFYVYNKISSSNLLFSFFKKLVGENIYRFRFLKNEKIGGIDLLCV